MKDSASKHTDAHLSRAATIIQEGGLVVFPTETVYGLGADALNAQAVAAIFAAKGRPADNPLIVHVHSVAAIAPLVAEFPRTARLLFDAFAPGPLTVVLAAADTVPSAVTAGLRTVAVRIPAHPLAMALLERSGRPIAAPSANRSGEPSPTTVSMARRTLGDRVDCYLDGGPCEVGLESTVVSVGGNEVVILRPGGISEERIRAVLPGASVGAAKDSDPARPVSPGTKHRHYQPRAIVVTWDAAGQAAESGATLAALLGRIHAELSSVRLGVIGLEHDVAGIERRLSSELALGSVTVKSASSVAEYARRLYGWFGELDDRGVECILAIPPPDHGLGRAIRDRLGRASTARATALS